MARPTPGRTSTAPSASTAPSTSTAQRSAQHRLDPASPRVTARGGGARLRTALRWLGRATLDRMALWDTPATSYYIVLGSTVVLVGIGLVMVLSSSSVTSMSEDGSPFAVFFRQFIFAAVGLPVMWACSRVSVAQWKRIGWLLIVGAVLAQLLVFTPFGLDQGGNRNWIQIGPFRGQPSEAAKLALVVWCSMILARKSHLLHDWRHVALPLAPVAGLVLGLVLLGHDLGTGLVMMLVLAVMLFVAGVRLRLFALGFAAAAALAGFMVAISSNRRERLSTWLSGQCTDIWGTCWQSTHGKWALASGGWWLGLGASREKWDGLPEAHNDYIYAIIGEELGLPGTLTILLLLGLVAIGGLRIIQRHPDPFVKIATSGVLAWVIGQALINIGVVLGLLPVIGVPLPLVSSGGSALITSLATLGMLLSFARSEPEAQQALDARVALVRRTLAVAGSRDRRRT
jgi:cell division protein FtsW